MATRVISASVIYASEAARDAASGWGEGDVVYVTGVGYTVYDGADWAAFGGGGGGLTNPLEADLDLGGFLLKGAADGAATGANIELTPGDTGEGGVGVLSGGSSDDGTPGAVVEVAGAVDGEAGAIEVKGGNGQAAGIGGDARLRGGSGDAGNQGGAYAIATGGSDTTPGRIQIRTEGTTGSAGFVLTAQGDNSAIWAGYSGPVAAFVDPTTATPEDIANALIAAGLMAAS